MSFYAHEPLDAAKKEIRVLELQPGAYNSDIQVRLNTTTLGSPIEYEALSYAWGDPQLTLPIHILSADSSTQYTFDATRNLVSALNDIRSPDQVRIIWADAICINQNDNEEKSHQVRLMGEIFSQAIRVLAYVGEEADSSNEVMKMITQDIRNFETIRFNLLKDLRWDMVWTAWKAFCERPYFYRCWIMQEVALARKLVLVCGRLLCEWTNFLFTDWGIALKSTAVFDRAVDGKENLSFWRALGMIYKLERARFDKGKVSLKSVLGNMHGRDVTDPRDMVYSSLSMAKDVNATTWDVNYKQEAVEIFYDTTEKIVRQTGSLDIICHSDWSEKHDHGCSWIPRFAGGFGKCDCRAFQAYSLTSSYVVLPPGKGRPSEAYIWPDMSPYTASGTLKADAAFDRESRRLTTVGVMVDKISKALAMKPDPVGGQGCRIPTEWKTEAMAFTTHSDGPLSQEIRETRNFEIFWRVLVMDRKPARLRQEEFIDDDDNLAAMEDADEIFDRVEGLLERFRAPAPLQWARECEEWMKGNMTVRVHGSNFGNRIHLWALGGDKRYIITERTMGLGRRGSKEGDIIAILFGCSVPVILRPSKGSTGDYHFIGEAYVHGIMDGEVIKDLNDPNNKEYHTQHFTLI